MTAVKTAGLQRALLLAEIEERNMTERNVVQIEITIELKLPLKQLRKPASENAATGDPGRQPAKRTQRFEWRVFRIVNKVTPVAMIDRPAAGQDRRDAGRTIAENRGQSPAIGCRFTDERIFPMYC